MLGVELVLPGLAALGLLAYANGANDVSKSVAPLVGGCGSPEDPRLLRRALLWGGIWSALGVLTALGAAGAIFQVFSRGIVLAELTPRFALAVLLGASGWVLLSTRLGLPVSTTHAIVGGTITTGVLLYGMEGVAWPSVVPKVLVPLAASPMAAFLLTWLPGHIAPRNTRNIITRIQNSLLVLPGASRLHRRACGRGMALGHWSSAGVVGFARGLNDGPKMAALGVLLLSGRSPAGDGLLYTVVALGVLGGSLLAGRRVTETLARRVTDLDCSLGLRAGSATVVLVGAGAALGAPMSTTHVSSGAIIGVGAGQKRLVWPTVRNMLLAWGVTLPAAGGMAALAALVLG